MADLDAKTKNYSSPQGKQRVYFCCHPDDFDLYFDPVCEDIFKYADCAIWYKKDQNVQWDKEGMELKLGEMQLFVIPVTSKFLEQENEARCIEFSFAVEQHIPILPLIQEEGLEEEFSRICGPWQCYDKTADSNDQTKIPFDKKLKDYLSSVLLDDELQKKVRSAFDAYIFLSYRKKDRAYARELMKMIRKNDFCRDIAIWYDEYLTPEEDFNDMIREAMEKSSLVTFAVTPNLLEPGNYVMDHEYADAKNSGKLILSVEMKNTDRELLMEDYPGMPDPIDAHDQSRFSDALLADIQKLNITGNDQESQHLYLIGLAYLNGIDVETDYSRAIQLLTLAAEKEEKNAQYELGFCYANGIGVTKDDEKSIYWLTKAADQGLIEAQSLLGSYYMYEAKGYLGEWEKAVEYFRRAAEQGDAYSQRELGKYCEFPLEDREEALKWYTMAVDQGDADAQCDLAHLYIFGVQDQDEVVPDYEKAVGLYMIAAEQGNVSAQRALGDLYRDGHGVLQNYEQAVQWYKKASEQGDKQALVSLSRLYNSGYGRNGDYEKTVRWFLNAADQGDADYQYYVGYLYEIGLGVSKDYALAFKWYNAAYENATEKVSEKNFLSYAQAATDSILAIADCYYYGRGVAQDYVQAFKWYKKAKEEWGIFTPGIAIKLGDCYYNGQGVTRDYEKAVEWYTKVAEYDPDAWLKLGKCYYKGTGVEQDYAEAAHCFKEASENGNEESKQWLNKMVKKGLI